MPIRACTLNRLNTVYQTLKQNNKLIVFHISAAQKVLKKTCHKVSQPNGRVYEFSVKKCTTIQEGKYSKVR